MQVILELSQTEETRYLERRQSLLDNPTAIVRDFEDEWLRVVDKIGTPPPGYPSLWLLTMATTEDRDVHNLKLAHDWGHPWESVPFDPGYLVLDGNLADRVLSHGIKSYGRQFLFDFDFDRVDFAFQEIFGYGDWDSIVKQYERMENDRPASPAVAGGSDMELEGVPSEGF